MENLKHKDWRRIAKKMRRKRIRQQLAQKRDEIIKRDEENKLQNPLHQYWIKQKEALEVVQKQTEEIERNEAEEAWMKRELLAQMKFRKEQKRKEKIEAANQAIRLKIQKEFEELQKVEQEKRNKKILEVEQIERQHQILMDKINDYIQGNGDIPKELFEKANTNPNHEKCPFFSKTATCRYGDKCNYNHSRPGMSRIILIRNFFSHIIFEQSQNTEYGTDIVLEYSNEELYKDYETFYNDVIPEMESFGRIVNFKVCQNCQAHLRGNLYVEFFESRDALKAYMKLQGRYYAGKRLNVEFCTLISWRSAICGEHFLRKCPKGRNCNFLHIFKNPGNMYTRFQSTTDSKTLNRSSQQNSNSNSSCKRTTDRNWKLSESRSETAPGCSSKDLDKQNGDKYKILNWDHIDGNENKIRNWRWSESPENEICLFNEKSDSRTARKRSFSKSSRDSPNRKFRIGHSRSKSSKKDKYSSCERKSRKKSSKKSNESSDSKDSVKKRKRKKKSRSKSKSK